MNIPVYSIAEQDFAVNHSPGGVAPGPAVGMSTRQPRVALSRLVLAIVAIVCLVIWTGVGCAGFVAIEWFHSSPTACGSSSAPIKSR